jgi:site-specific DNA recombinase
VIDGEAAIEVRRIFSRYLALKSVPLLVDELNGQNGADADSATSSRQLHQPSTRGKLYHLLSNVVYIGKARHKDRIYDGEHEAIIDEETFAAAGALLKARTPDLRGGPRASSQHLLTGLLFDETATD